jgi:SAM-dependent methyltransferase
LGSNFYVFDLTKDFPFENNSISSFLVFDVVEHIPRWERISNDKIAFPFINFMNEINRCLKSGGYFLAVTPAYPSKSAFQDPTHVNFITEETINYFSEDGWAKNLDYEYSGDFRIVHQSWVYSNFVNNSLKKRSSNGLIYAAELFINSIKIFKNIYINNNRPTHLMWILQKI